jgi:hypothetical protein
MAAFIFLASCLIQKGASESNEPGKKKEDPQKEKKPDSPWPVHRGGLALKLYSHSLTLALVGLFLFSFVMHGVGGRLEYNEEARSHGQPELGLLGFLGSSTFWFESLQNWQSEFLSVGVLIVLSIFLRQKDSPESKKVTASHSETGA